MGPVFGKLRQYSPQNPSMARSMLKEIRGRATGTRSQMRMMTRLASITKVSCSIWTANNCHSATYRGVSAYSFNFLGMSSFPTKIPNKSVILGNCIEMILIDHSNCNLSW